MKGNVNGRLQTRDRHNGFPAYSPDLPPKTEAERPLHAPQKPQVVFCILKEEVSLDHGRRRDISSKSMKLMKKNCNERKFISDISVLKMAVRASQMNQKSGRPLTSTTDLNIGQVRDLIVADIKITIDNISKILGISYDQQRETRLSICKDLIETENNDSYLFKTIGVFFLIHKPKNNHTRKKKIRLDESKGKVLLVVLFDYQGLVYYGFIKEGEEKETTSLNQNSGHCYMIMPLLIEPLLFKTL
ncbi:hypothetical protein LAZ67_6003316 [Cordylochernes scorpioides]|uniref:Uncharacterized protein n=1 Tax=Cordylochernes scorpioides TaxID=51811 RepID=A0ABY6KQI3_9ARAC|nr:hypothetical protein LAZ67_6003316 [Cordylochernes scorpioides]